MAADERSGDDEGKRVHGQIGDRFPLPTIPSPPGSSISSLSSQESIAALVHPPTPEMGDYVDGYRRRRAGITGHENDGVRGKPAPKLNSRRPRPSKQDGSNSEAGDNPIVCSSEEGHGSDISSLPTSEDVELEHYPSDDGISDDEETGFAKNNKQQRKQKRASITTVDGNSLASIRTAKQEQKLADKSVIHALIINALLIASWYLFSVSISVVGHQKGSLLFSVCAK